jgi:putative methionine-R-sulfoxide reductase with GAF domain
MDAGPNDDLIEGTVARLHEDEPAFDWVGVYLVDDDELILGPYRGKPTDHVRIPRGQGVCGAVAEAGETEVVPDVRARAGHIACDLATRSEAVAPIVRGGTVVGVLDVDSNRPDAFGPREVRVIEDAAREIAAGVAATAS